MSRLPSIALLLLAACEATPVPLPAEPTVFTRHDRYQFGDSVRNRDVKAWIDAYDLLEPTFGELRQGSRELPATIPPEAVRAALAARLEPQGWVPVAELADWRKIYGDYAFGWSKSGKLYAIVGLEHRPAEMKHSPVTIITNIGDQREPV